MRKVGQDEKNRWSSFYKERCLHIVSAQQTRTLCHPCHKDCGHQGHTGMGEGLQEGRAPCHRRQVSSGRQAL